MVWNSCCSFWIELSAVEISSASSVEMGTVMTTSTKVFSTACKK